MKQVIARFYNIALVLLITLLTQGCYALDNDGTASNDHIAYGLGLLGIITFFAGIGAPKSSGLVIIGIILILA